MILSDSDRESMPLPYNIHHIISSAVNVVYDGISTN